MLEYQRVASKARVRHSEAEIKDQLDKQQYKKSEGSQAAEEMGKNELNKARSRLVHLLQRSSLSGMSHILKDSPGRGHPSLLTPAASLLLEGFSCCI